MSVAINDIVETKATTIFCIPTTCSNIGYAASLIQSHCAVVLADRCRFPGLDGSLTPTELLNAYPSQSKCSIPIISFTDQFVNSINAPMVVDTGEACEYRSSIEVVCSERFRIPLQFMCGNRWRTAPVVASNADLVEAMELMSEYFISCKKIETDWLASSVQIERTISHRHTASTLLRHQYESMVMASAVQSQMTVAHARAIDCLFKQGKKNRSQANSKNGARI